MIPAVVLFAIVTHDRAILHGAPRDSSPRHAVLYEGDVLEVRGEKSSYLEVYDHRRERAGFVRSWQVKTYAVVPESAGEMLAVVRFLRDVPGHESLGIAVAALYLKAADAKEVGAEIFDAIGTMAERVAKRASRKFGAGDELDAAHMEVIASYGVKLQSFEREGRTQVCYDGEAFRRVLAFGGDAARDARAALAATRPECVHAETERERIEIDRWRGEVLDRIDPAKLEPYLAARVRVRSATVLASIAYDRMRLADHEGAAAAATNAIKALAGVDRKQLAEDDEDAYTEAAIHVAATRWATERGVRSGTAESATPQGAGENAGAVASAKISAGREAGETCVRIGDAERCTFGIVWSLSVMSASNGRAFAIAVQPADGLIELWLAHKNGAAWTIDILPPSTGSAGPGYIEPAGFSPDGTKLLAARESRTQEGYEKRFEIIDTATLETIAQARDPSALKRFKAWQSPAWKAGTLALR